MAEEITGEQKITSKRLQECANHLTQLALIMNQIDAEILEQMLRDLSRDSAIGPLMDPTRWRDEGLFDKSYQTEKVIRAILVFKKEVTGIGFFR